MNDAGIKACVAIGAITAMEIAALLTGHDGTILAAAVAVVAGLGGFVAGVATVKAKK